MAEIIFTIAAGIALLAFILSFIRLAVGPTVVDRIVALDVMTIVSMSILVYIAYRAGRPMYLDVALVYGLMSFMGVVAAARYLERGWWSLREPCPPHSGGFTAATGKPTPFTYSSSCPYSIS